MTNAVTLDLLQMEEALLKAEEDGCCSVECVTELRSLRHLDRVIDSAASSIVVVAFYSRVSTLYRTCNTVSGSFRVSRGSQMILQANM